jgi:hypothetical protein
VIVRVTSTQCEVVGGPRDGDIIVVPGLEPPLRLRVILAPDGSTMHVWHPAAPGLPDMDGAELVVLERHYQARAGHPSWRYLWPHS